VPLIAELGNKTGEILSILYLMSLMSLLRVRMYKTGETEQEYTPGEKERITKVIFSENPEILRELKRVRHYCNILQLEIIMTLTLFLWYLIFYCRFFP
jgi:hypothetical protein